MKERDAWALFAKIIQDDLPKLQENLIVSEGSVYRAFGRYVISPQSLGYAVTKDQDTIATFGEMRTALGWCIADKYRQTRLAKTILDLDQRKQAISADYRVRVRLYERLPEDQQEYIGHKIETRRNKLIAINNELTQCIGLAKYWQIRGFNNETERIGRTASNRKNR